MTSAPQHLHGLRLHHALLEHFRPFARLKESIWTKWVIGSISGSALFDILENIRIMKGVSALAGPAKIQVPRPFSLAKWTLLAFALIFLGFLVWSRKGRLYQWLAAALFVSGGLTLAGLAIPKAMVCGGYGFGVVFILILVYIRRYPVEAVLFWIEYL